MAEGASITDVTILGKKYPPPFIMLLWTPSNMMSQTLTPCSLYCSLQIYYYYYYYYTGFIMHVRSFTKWRISIAYKVTSQWRNTQLYRAVLSLDLKVSVDTVMSEITVSGRFFQIVGEAWQKSLLEKLITAGLYCIYIYISFKHNAHFLYDLTHLMRHGRLCSGPWVRTGHRLQ